MVHSKGLPDFVVERGFLAKESCEALVNGDSKRSGYRRSAGRMLERRVDISHVAFSENRALFDAITSLAKRTNVWRLVLASTCEDMRVQRYRRHDFTDTHTDFDYPSSDYVKLTIVVVLTERSRWKGGELQIGNMRRSPRLDRGDAVIFPSFLQHRVTRVTKGVRLSLSAWISGPPPR
jgi:predicted 2-oxoglutarate/Fe(II)-dependent dioxygenase YbiX